MFKVKLKKLKESTMILELKKKKRRDEVTLLRNLKRKRFTDKIIESLQSDKEGLKKEVEERLQINDSREADVKKREAKKEYKMENLLKDICTLHQDNNKKELNLTTG